MIIGNIDGSSFYGNSNIGGVGVIGVISSGSGTSSINQGGLFGGGGRSGGKGGSGYGLFANGSSTILIGNINTSSFFGNANAGDVTTIGAGVTNQGGIFGGGGASSSSSGAGGSGYGLYVNSSNAVTVGNIAGSLFYGNVNTGNVSMIGASVVNNGGTFGDRGSSGGAGANGYGMYLQSVANSVYAGAISNNKLGANANVKTPNRKTNQTGTANKGIGTDLYMKGSSIIIASIANNTFYSTSTFTSGSLDRYIDFQGSLQVNGISYALASSLLSYLQTALNTFAQNGSQKSYVWIDLSSATPDP